jgi:hypothetical protein
MLSCDFLALVHGSDIHLFAFLRNVRWSVHPNQVMFEHFAVAGGGVNSFRFNSFFGGPD